MALTYAFGPIGNLRFDAEVGRYLTRSSLTEEEKDALKAFFERLQRDPIPVDQNAKSITHDTWIFNVANHVVYLKITGAGRGIVVGIQSAITLSEPPIAVTTSENYEKQAKRNVLVMHGRDTGKIELVRSLLEGAGLKPIMLSEQPASGRTIFERIYDAVRQTDFAVVLLTPDDRRESTTGGSNRARQNVIFELGLLVGSLGQNHVCLLTTDDNEVPSDLDGVVQIQFDPSGTWKLQLIRELATAGLQINPERLARG